MNSWKKLIILRPIKMAKVQTRMLEVASIITISQIHSKVNFHLVKMNRKPKQIKISRIVTSLIKIILLLEIKICNFMCSLISTHQIIKLSRMQEHKLHMLERATKKWKKNSIKINRKILRQLISSQIFMVRCQPTWLKDQHLNISNMGP